MSSGLAVPCEQAFAAALLDPSRAVPAGLSAWNGSDPAVRFAVYRNNVVVTLVNALGEAFPLVCRLVGEEFFRAMARRYVCAHPPHSPVLADYGDGFADWLADFEPASGEPYLSDMARLERLRVRAYHAADAQAVDPAVLGRALAAPEHLAGACLALHPSLGVLLSAHGVVSLWRAHQADDVDAAIASVDLCRPESAIVLRQGDDAVVIPVALSTGRFVQALAQGQALGEAAHQADHHVARPAPQRAGDAFLFDLAASLSILLRHGAVVAWRAPGDAT